MLTVPTVAEQGGDSEEERERRGDSCTGHSPTILLLAGAPGGAVHARGNEHNEARAEQVEARRVRVEGGEHIGERERHFGRVALRVTARTDTAYLGGGIEKCGDTETRTPEP